MPSERAAVCRDGDSLNSANVWSRLSVQRLLSFLHEKNGPRDFSRGPFGTYNRFSD